MENVSFDQLGKITGRLAMNIIISGSSEQDNWEKVLVMLVVILNSRTSALKEMTNFEFNWIQLESIVQLICI